MADAISNFTRDPHRKKGEENSSHCPQCGPYTQTLIEQFDGGYNAQGCSFCQFQALRCEPVDSERHIAAKAADRQAKINDLLIGSGITPRFSKSTFATFQADDAGRAKALAKCRGYAEQFNTNYDAGRAMLLVGNIGTGKTHLACAIVQHVIREHGAQAVITSAAEIIRIFKGAMRKGAQYDDRDVINELASFDLLVIDEVGAQAGTEYEKGLMHEVIDRRYQLVLPTILASNLTLEQFTDFIGERAIDRLRQGGGIQVGFTWPSVRREVEQ